VLAESAFVISIANPSISSFSALEYEDISISLVSQVLAEDIATLDAKYALGIKFEVYLAILEILKLSI